MKTNMLFRPKGIIFFFALLSGFITTFSQGADGDLSPGYLSFSLNEEYTIGSPVEVLVEYTKVDPDAEDLVGYSWEIRPLNDLGEIGDPVFSQAYTGDPAGYFTFPADVTDAFQAGLSYNFYLSIETTSGKAYGMVKKAKWANYVLYADEEICCGSVITATLSVDGLSLLQGGTMDITAYASDAQGNQIPGVSYNSGPLTLTFGPFAIPGSESWPCEKYYNIVVAVDNGSGVYYVTKVVKKTYFVMTTKKTVCCNDWISGKGLFCSGGLAPAIINHKWVLTPSDALGNITPPASYTSGTIAGAPNGSSHFFHAGQFTTPMQCGSYYRLDLEFSDGLNTWVNSKVIYISPAVQPIVTGPTNVCGTGNYCEVNVPGPNNSYIWRQYIGYPAAVGGNTSCVTVPYPGTYTGVGVFVTNQYGCKNANSADLAVTNSYVSPDFYITTGALNGFQFYVQATRSSQAAANDLWKIEETQSIAPYAGITNTMLTNAAWSVAAWYIPVTFGGYNGNSNTGWNNASINQYLGSNNVLINGEYYRITHTIINPTCGDESTSIVFNQSGANGYKSAEAGTEVEGIAPTLYEKTQSLSVYPNPSGGMVSFTYAMNETSTGAIIITDLSGRTVMTIDLSSKETTAEADLSAYKDGIYFVNFFEDGLLLKTEKFVLQH